MSHPVAISWIIFCYFCLSNGEVIRIGGCCTIVITLTPIIKAQPTVWTHGSFVRIINDLVSFDTRLDLNMMDPTSFLSCGSKECFPGALSSQKEFIPLVLEWCETLARLLWLSKVSVFIQRGEYAAARGKDIFLLGYKHPALRFHIDDDVGADVSLRFCQRCDQVVSG